MNWFESLKEVVKNGDLGLVLFGVTLYGLVWLATLPGGMVRRGWAAVQLFPPRMEPTLYSNDPDRDWIDQMWVDDRRESERGSQ